MFSLLPRSVCTDPKTTEEPVKKPSDAKVAGWFTGILLQMQIVEKQYKLAQEAVIGSKEKKDALKARADALAIVEKNIKLLGPLFNARASTELQDKANLIKSKVYSQTTSPARLKEFKRLHKQQFPTFCKEYTKKASETNIAGVGGYKGFAEQYGICIARNLNKTIPPISYSRAGRAYFAPNPK